MGTNDADRTGDQDGRNTIKAVDTSLSIVEALKRERTAKVSELAQLTGHSKANVYKHLNTLKAQGFVERDDDEFRLGLGYLDLGGLVREQLEGQHIIKPKIAEIADKTEEVAQYMVESNGKSVIVFKEVGHQGVSLRTRVGAQLPIHQVASGKAMLAFMPDTRVDEIVQRHGLPAATENTITDTEALKDELAEIRERGYATNRSESTKKLFAVSVPVMSVSENVIGACTVSGPTHRMNDTGKTSQVVETLRSVTNEIELNLAHS
ncbi:IclR family transcriptional regulator [Natrinema versiforme]|uniref:Transcriptional regulator, IclR family protein n=1 Tax=Natrinema versiforme JCM 10478 TaxID=1227496 RepID=L9XMG8_9EURY|nr:IclR family transcriptional regulator [Natrinema versiforme]ELY62930.1 transcriptional regulator, IclR family protein [Natrinema versiforme JCM 10478]